MKMRFVAEMFGEVGPKIYRGAAPEKSGRTGQRGQEAQLARDEPVVERVSDQLGSALHPQDPHHVVFVGFDGARGQLQGCSNLLHPPALRDEPQHLALPRRQRDGSVLLRRHQAGDDVIRDAWCQIGPPLPGPLEWR